MSDPDLICSGAFHGGQRSLIRFHDAPLPFACAHLVGCEAVLIVRNGAFVFAACVFARPIRYACREHACGRYNRGPNRKTNFHPYPLDHAGAGRIFSFNVPTFPGETWAINAYFPQKP